MMAGRGENSSAAGGPARHIPVMLSEVISALEPQDGKIFIDGTFGAGGYSRGLLEAARCSVLAIDRDPRAGVFARMLEEDFPGRLTFVLGRFAEMQEIAQSQGLPGVDGVALDLGVSSMQLDTPERGFSFMQDGPLDMRMSSEGPTAADVVNMLPERELTAIIATLGEEKRARAIARAIAAQRAEAPIERTGELAALVARVVGRKHDETKHPGDPHLPGDSPLSERGAVGACPRLGRGRACPQGQGAARRRHLSFAGRPDRQALLRQPERAGAARLPAFAGQGGAPYAPSFQLLNRRPLSPTKEEIRPNPRARSARLRAGIRTEAPPHALDLASLGVPRPALPA